MPCFARILHPQQVITAPAEPLFCPLIAEL
jgi:hypothetical protein